ncbi:hypothetical protein [Pseudooceanicola nanhaiensis]|uniref:hypothetical protein n=1 Tax=Pseudooceanicola nanhaiensis TaxID=375761 RepID=UPI001CD6B41F|nr:hypothetical protein [Pseudooceanicola nanhaiensis]MCA0921322.1 hypothetical protein [Pseudooceanicola nanhaiensis]
MPRNHPLLLALLALFVVGHVISIGVALYDPALYPVAVGQEDGPLEYLTAVFLFLAGLVLFRRAAQLRGHLPLYTVALTVLYGAMYVFVAGEEISWGQRIFGWSSGEYFVENNFQAETNFHNLVVGDHHLASTLFGNWLTPVLLLYLLVLPLLWPRAKWVQGFVRALAVPVPAPREAFLAVAASVIVLSLDFVYRNFELYEFAFSIISLMIFLSPWNAAMYGLERARVRATAVAA